MWECCSCLAGSAADNYNLASIPLSAGRATRETAKGRNRTRNAHFRRFSLIFGSLESQICAENRRKPQIFAGNRRKPQIFAETGFSHLLSPFWRAPIGAGWPGFGYGLGMERLAVPVFGSGGSSKLGGFFFVCFSTVKREDGSGSSFGS